MTIGVIAKLKIQEGKNANFESTFLELQKAVRGSEPGNEFLFAPPIQRRQ
jgi:quinol monooxygenase YgiN